MLLAHLRALNAKLDSHAESDVFLGSAEKAALEPEYQWSIDGQGWCNIQGKTDILIERNADFSVVRYRDQIFPNVNWHCISSKKDVEDFFKNTPQQIELASLYTTGGGSAARRMKVTVGGRSLLFEDKDGGCCIQ
jgi:hypothetical protein